MENRFCDQCGEPLSPTARLCPGCGGSLVDPSTTSSPSSLQRLMGKRVLGMSTPIVVAAVIASVALLASIGVEWRGITDSFGAVQWPIAFGKESTLVIVCWRVCVEWRGITDRYGVVHWPIAFGKESTGSTAPPPIPPIPPIPPKCTKTVPSNDPECQRFQEGWQRAEQDRRFRALEQEHTDGLP